jgi:NADPH:quinone reductase-like Zn-dependent oxidoreductase
MRVGSAVQYDRYGGFDVVNVVPQERPEPGPDEVVIEVVSAGLNHVERFLREGRFRKQIKLDFPVGQGVDVAGIVRLRGSNVRDLAIGAEVMGHVPGSGSHATWARVPATSLIKKPESVPWEVAGSLWLAGCTASTIVQDAHLGPEDAVVVSAAAGGVGHIECQLALAAGAFVIGTCSPRNHDYLWQIGVTPVTYGDGLEARIAEAADGRPVTAFIDNHGGDNPALAEALGVDRTRFASQDHRRDAELRFLRAPGVDDEGMAVLRSLTRMLEDHKLRVLISGFYPFEYIVDAYEDLAEMHSRGKVVIGMQPVETGARLGWYRSEKARTLHEAS